MTTRSRMAALALAAAALALATAAPASAVSRAGANTFYVPSGGTGTYD